ncbi:MAG TPA: nucleotidyltransferase family protein [Stellaceae bacterium]|nr:nucleotidyltransferase family protein [Stellaceae bacterium]
MIRPRSGMVLAAGRGERLRPLTDNLPKPLVQIDERTMLDHAIDRLVAVGIERVVVNVHYLADQIIEHLKPRHDVEIVISREDKVLETGGGVTNALTLLGDEPFFVLNGDSFILNGKASALDRLAEAYDPDNVDAVLLLQRTASAVGYDGERGDFLLDQMGRPTRRTATDVAPYVFAGVQLLSPKLFRDVPAGPFSLNVIYDRAAESQRLLALVHDGEWYHVGTPDGLETVRAQLAIRRTER